LKLKQAAANVASRDCMYSAWVIRSFNGRSLEMDVPLLKLALFLDPRYRQAAIKMSAGSSSSDDSSSSVVVSDVTKGLAALKTTAGKLAQQQGYSQDEVMQLFNLMDLYAHNRHPFNQQSTTPTAYWTAVLASPTAAAAKPELLARLGLKLSVVRPTAAAIEQVNPCVNVCTVCNIFSGWACTLGYVE
jgi:hypothetical protein